MTAVDTHPDGAVGTGPTGTRDDLVHLLRRAGFTPTSQELDHAQTIGYRATVERLLAPPAPDTDSQLLLERHLPATAAPHEAGMAAPAWMWRLVASEHPLREKLALFWHDLFATAYKDGIVGIDQAAQIELFRRHGLGRFDDLLLRLSQDPAMLVWLDNQFSAVDRVNENYGRELLELFSMGIGAYTEADVQASATAFTGWSVRPGPSAFHLGPRPMWFTYDAGRHDHRPQRFLDQPVTQGQDIVAAIVAHPATARFVVGRLYTFLVEEEAHEPTIDEVAATFTRTRGDLRATVRHLLCSPRFLDPALRRARVKTPVELVVGLARNADAWTVPDHRLGELVDAAGLMGQTLLAPPNVGGWPSGEAWLQGASLLERVNHAGRVVGASGRLARRVDGLRDGSDAPGLVDACLRALDVDHLSDASRDALTSAVTRLTAQSPRREHVVRSLKLVVALPEFQYC